MRGKAAAYLASLPPLEDRLNAFMRGLPGTEPIDYLPGLPPSSKRADFLLDHRSGIAEVKNLTSDVSHQIDTVMARYRDRPEYPVFYGTMQIEHIICRFPAEGEQIRRQIFNRLTKSLEQAVREADEQIGQTKAIFGIPDAWGILVVANQHVDALPPDIILGRINSMLLRRDDRTLRFSNITCALIISESHLMETPDGTAGPVFIQLDGPLADACPACPMFLEHFLSAWSAHDGLPQTVVEDMALRGDRFHSVKAEFARQQPIKPRYEHWREHYRQNRFLAEVPDKEFANQLSDLFKYVTPHFLKGGKKLSKHELARFSELFTCYLEEASLRGFDMRDIPPFALAGC
jgi:hypothetical protein